jgi:Fe-S oxidoreductase
MQVMIRIHFFSVLLLVAVLPFTFLRHVAAAPVNVFFRKQNPRAELRGISMDEGPIGAETYRDFTWKQLLDAEACVSCGRCEKNCPASISGKPLSPRKVIQDILEQAASGISAPRLSSLITEDEVWSCTTCMACLEHCPVYIEPMDRIIEMRRCQTMRKGMPPPEAGSLIRNLEIFGDVQGNGPARRADWAFDQGAPLFSSKNTAAEILLWVGCSGAFHPRYREVSRAMVKILKAAEVPFGILGKDERCCGDPARRMGEEGLFLELAKKNIEILKKFEIKKVVTLCPHCFNTLKNEYPPIEKQQAYPQNAAAEVVHAVEFIVELIEGGRIYPKYPLDKIIAIHDPCYLGRGNNIYEPQRKIVRSLPGTRLKELKRHHEKGFCCGGGGGGMWLHEHLGRRMNVIRAEEVLESRIELLGTACPYCLTMLDDGLKSLEPERLPEVMDVVEMVAASIG